MSKQKVKAKKPRNWISVAAKFRNSAGAMKGSKKEAKAMACRNWKDNDESPLNKKYFEVTANSIKRFTMKIYADNKSCAKNIASNFTEISDNWIEDYGYYNFSISDIKEIDEEEIDLEDLFCIE